MEKLNKLTEKIKFDKELLSALPRNNAKNNAIYLENLEKLETIYASVKNEIVDSLKKRNEQLLSLEINKDIEQAKKDLESIKYKINIINELNTPYEKIELDKVIYDISKYYKGTLKKVNNDIMNAIKLFELAGITLTFENFIYSSYAKNYMKVFFEEKDQINSERLKHTFEEIYWKRPSIVMYIQLNLQYLYYKNIDKFNKYIADQVLNKVGNLDKEKLVDEYSTSWYTYNQLINSDDYTFLNKFINKELEIKDFSEVKMDELYKKYTDNIDDIENGYLSIIKFSNTVIEYKKYFEYKIIIDDLKKMYSNKDKNAVLSKNKLKEISKYESMLENISTPKKSLFKFGKDKNISEEQIIEKLKILYLELDDIVIKERMFKTINDESSIHDLLAFASSHYAYIAKVYKNLNSDISDEEIYKKYIEIKNYLLEPSNNIITNLNAFKEYNVAMIISDKYKLDNLKVNEEMFVESNLDNLINQTHLLICYYHIKRLNKISISLIEDYFKISNQLAKK